mmetsp:Transcript_21352/g.46634  ORF Transcript_21352/g.46634 Transcript_21352/m.46634 type:complete len:114 (+) Transcript_21352:819-1160(+)
MCAAHFGCIRDSNDNIIGKIPELPNQTPYCNFCGALYSSKYEKYVPFTVFNDSTGGKAEACLPQRFDRKPISERIVARHFIPVIVKPFFVNNYTNVEKEEHYLHNQMDPSYHP